MIWCLFISHSAIAQDVTKLEGDILVPGNYIDSSTGKVPIPLFVLAQNSCRSFLPIINGGENTSVTQSKELCNHQCRSHRDFNSDAMSPRLYPKVPLFIKVNTSRLQWSKRSCTCTCPRLLEHTTVTSILHLFQLHTITYLPTCSDDLYTNFTKTGSTYLYSFTRWVVLRWENVFKKRYQTYPPYLSRWGKGLQSWVAIPKTLAHVEWVFLGWLHLAMVSKVAFFVVAGRHWILRAFRNIIVLLLCSYEIRWSICCHLFSFDKVKALLAIRLPHIIEL